MKNEGFPQNPESDNDFEAATQRPARVLQLGERVTEITYVSPSSQTPEIDATLNTQGSSGGTRDSNGGKTIPK